MEIGLVNGPDGLWMTFPEGVRLISINLVAQQVSSATASVGSGARLDRLPLSSFHWRILFLIGAGAFLDAFDVYLAGGVMAAMVKEGFSDLDRNALFISGTFVGMLIGAGLAGYVGDRYGRRYSYQFNLLLFGSASLLACFAPNIGTLIVLRFIMGIGLGAELVVAAGTLCEFIPPSHRGRWAALLGLIISSGLFVATTVGYLVIPTLGWRWMFAIAGICAMIIWIIRKTMPESPRWLESVGRLHEAEATLRAIEKEVEAKTGPLPPPVPAFVARISARPATFGDLFARSILARTLIGAFALAATNIAVYTFVAWLPTFLVKQGQTIVQSLAYTTIMSIGSIAGGLFAFVIADRISRKWSIILICMLVIVFGLAFPRMVSPEAITAVGFCLVASIYAFVCLVSYGFVPELFPTALRLRGAGFAGMVARAAAISTPYLAVFLFEKFGLTGVLGFIVIVFAVLVIILLIADLHTDSVSLEEASSGTMGGPNRIVV